MIEKKKILFIDLDGVVADFDLAIKEYDPSLETSDSFINYETRSKRVDEICELNRNIFRELKLIDGAYDAVNKLFDSKKFDIYFLSTPMWNIPESFTDKRIWLEEIFGKRAEKRLILSHRKDLNIGHYLIDDRLKNGSESFTGDHIHIFTDPKFLNWNSVIKYLLPEETDTDIDLLKKIFYRQ